MDKATYVLVHGAFHGAWCWKRVAERLRAAGHAVHALSHTGSAERAHLLSGSLDLEVYLEDALALLESEELRDVILVGHSLGGMTVSGVADRRPELLRRLVYLDAIVPVNGGLRLRETLPAEVYEERQKKAREVRGVRCFMPPHPGYFGVTDPADVEWVGRRMTPMAVALLESDLALTHPIGNGVPATYVRCTSPAMRMIESEEQRARALGWEIRSLPTGHDAMVSMPGPTADILLSFA